MRRSSAVIVVFLLLLLSLLAFLVFEYRRGEKEILSREEETELQVSSPQPKVVNEPISFSRIWSESQAVFGGGDTGAIFDEGEITKVIEAGMRYEVSFQSGVHTVLVGVGARTAEIVGEANEGGEVVRWRTNLLSLDQMGKEVVIGSKVLIKYHEEDIQESDGQKTITVEEFDIIK